MDFSQMLDSAWKSEHRHILVSGESGSGKTSFLKNIACELEESIPIYIDLSAVNGDNYISKTILKEYCGYTEFDDTETVLENKLISILNEPADSSAKYVLLLDGIDEIPSWFTCNLCKELEMLAGCSGAQIVLAANNMNTVRANFFFEKLDCFSEYYVQPLSDDAVRQALEKRKIDYNGISDSVKVLLSRPYFLHGFIQLAENGSDVSKVGSAFDLYSAIVKHDIRIIGKRDGRLGSAEYALEKLLPALSSRLDRVAFDYTTLKSALKTAFLDTSYSNPGLDGISDALLARIKQNNNSNEHQLLEETAYDGIFNHYLNKVFLDRHYLVKTDDSHYRFCHSTWFQFFQIKHLVNEINKTDNKSIPNTVPEEQAERYFGDIKKAEKRISAEGLEPVAKQAFQKTVSGKAKERDKSKKIKRLICLCAFIILSCLILVGVIKRPKTPMYHFTLTPTDMTLTQYKEATETIKSRIGILADGEKYKFKQDGDKIEVSLPQSVFYDSDPINTMKNYVSREQLFYLIDLNAADMFTGSVEGILLRQEDIEKVSSGYGVIPGINADEYGLGPDEYSYITISMVPEWSDNNREKLEIWEKPKVAVNIGYDSWNYADNTILSDDFQTIFIPFENSFPKNYIEVIEFNLTHAPLAGAFYIEFEAEPIWEKINKSAYSGRFQRNESSIKGNTITLYYDTSIGDISTGAWIDLLRVLKDRMDALGEPYAVGYRSQGDTYQIIIKTLPNHVNTEILHLLTTRYPSIAASISCGLHRYNEADYSRLEMKVLGSDNGNVSLEVNSVIYNDHKSLGEFVKECVEDGATELWLCIEENPVLSTTVDDVTPAGQVLFRQIFWNGEQLTDETRWLAEFVKEIIEGSELPCDISYYGAISDVPKDTRIEDCYDVNSDERLSKILGKIRSVDPYLTTAGVSMENATQYNVFLHLPVNEELPRTAAEEVRMMYDAVDFPHSGFQTIIFFVGEEDNNLQECARICFRKDYSKNNVDIAVILKNGRYEKYSEELKTIILQDAFFQQFDVTWNGEKLSSDNSDTEISNLESASDTNAPTLDELKVMATSPDIKTRSNTGSNLVLPTEDEMLEKPFRTYTDNGKATGSIYIMPKPKGGYGFLGTIETGTEVWIVAETEYYYFFATDDGWIGWNGKSFFR